VFFVTDLQTQAWKQSKLDVAEHMYQKIAPSVLTYDPRSAEELADALYEIGKDLFAKKQYELSVRWLERAYDTLAEQHIEQLGDNAGELRLSVMQLLTKAHCSMKNPAALEKARHMVSLMDVVSMPIAWSE
jgi:tetratricopeptide (TPR) repeat protein